MSLNGSDLRTGVTRPIALSRHDERCSEDKRNHKILTIDLYKNKSYLR